MIHVHVQCIIQKYLLLFSEETPAYEVLRTKSILELVLTRFYKLQEESLFENIGMIKHVMSIIEF